MAHLSSVNELATGLQMSSAVLRLSCLHGSVLSCLPPVSLEPSQYADGAPLIGKALDRHRWETRGEGGERKGGMGTAAVESK